MNIRLQIQEWLGKLLVITLVSMDIAFTNLFYPEPSIWCFPPDLAVDVMNEKPFEDFKHKYLYNWMKPSQHLHYIYVPILDNFQHWFVMVISLKVGVLYRMSTQQSVEKMLEHGKIMKKVLHPFVILLKLF